MRDQSQPLDIAFKPERVLGTLLRKIRTEASWSTLRLSQEIGVHHSRLARIERGDLPPRDDEVDRVLAVLRVPESRADEVRRLAADVRQAAKVYAPPSSHVGGPDITEIQEVYWSDLEPVSEVRWYEYSLFPGLLQSRAYAEALFACSRLRSRDLIGVVDDEIRSAVEVRTSAQAMLHDEHRRFEFVVRDTALDFELAPPAAMAAQCFLLTQIDTLSNVSISILPAASAQTPAATFPFRVYDRERVEVDGLFGHVEHRASFQLRAYIDIFEELRSLSLRGPEARARIIESAERHLAEIEGHPPSLDLREPQL